MIESSLSTDYLFGKAKYLYLQRSFDTSCVCTCFSTRSISYNTYFGPNYLKYLWAPLVVHDRFQTKPNLKWTVEHEVNTKISWCEWALHSAFTTPHKLPQLYHWRHSVSRSRRWVELFYSYAEEMVMFLKRKNQGSRLLNLCTVASFPSHFSLLGQQLCNCQY